MLYEEDIINIYQTNEKDKNDMIDHTNKNSSINNLLNQPNNKDIVDLIDNDNTTKLVITNLKDYLADDCLNIVHKDYNDIIDNQETKVVDSLLNLELNEKYDEILIFDILSTLELEDYEKYLEHWISFLNENGTIYIHDICLENILNIFLTPNEYNGNEVTVDSLKMAISCLYGSKNYKRRSVIVPMIVANILNDLGIKNVAMQQQTTKVYIKGSRQ